MNIHDYLKMWIYYSITGELRIFMEEYLRGLLNNFPEDISETPESPAVSNLLKVRDSN